MKTLVHCLLSLLVLLLDSQLLLLLLLLMVLILQEVDHNVMCFQRYEWYCLLLKSLKLCELLPYLYSLTYKSLRIRKRERLCLIVLYIMILVFCSHILFAKNCFSFLTKKKWKDRRSTKDNKADIVNLTKEKLTIHELSNFLKFTFYISTQKITICRFYWKKKKNLTYSVQGQNLFLYCPN